MAVKDKNTNKETGAGKKEEPIISVDKDGIVDAPETTTEAPKTTTPPQGQGQDASKKQSTELPADLFADEIAKVNAPIAPDSEIVKNDYTAPPPEVGKGTTSGSSTDKKDTKNTGGGGTGAKKDGGTGTGKPPEGGFKEPAPTIASSQPVMSPAEEQTLAKQTAELLLDGYDGLHALARGFAKIKDEELVLMHEEGIINLNQEIPVKGKTITLQQFFGSFNADIDKHIVVTKNFKDAVMPPLIRVIIKHKWYMSDEMFLIGAFGKDMAQKAGLIWGLKKGVNELLNYFKSEAAKRKTVDTEHTEVKEEPKNQQSTQKKETVHEAEPIVQNADTINSEHTPNTGGQNEIDWHETDEGNEITSVSVVVEETGNSSERE